MPRLATHLVPPPTQRNLSLQAIAIRSRPREKPLSAIQHQKLAFDPTEKKKKKKKKKKKRGPELWLEGAVIECHTKDEFDAHMAKAKEDGKLVIIDFKTTWCPGCQQMAPVFAECAKKFPAAATFLKVDAEELEEVAKNYDFQKIPTFFFIRNGETLESFATVDPDKLRDTINKYYVSSAPA